MKLSRTLLHYPVHSDILSTEGGEAADGAVKRFHVKFQYTVPVIFNEPLAAARVSNTPGMVAFTNLQFRHNI